jgi:formylmethanofuran dehydrogenase subunit C
MYGSRLEELTKERGAFTPVDAACAFTGSLERQSVDNFKELTYTDRKAIHNLKYYTWVEQQGKTHEEIQAQWDPEYWRELFEDEAVVFDRLIEEFNAEVGLA